MNSVFLSYSSRDYFFAEMLAIKLAENGFGIWRDLGSIRAGDDWRQSIEEGIKESFAVVVALSASSAESSYVTFEWAYAIGMDKPVIPVKLSECRVHPKLEPMQHIDLSYPRALPWDALINRLKEVEAEQEPPADAVATTRVPSPGGGLDETANEILTNLNQRGFTMASFERLRERLNLNISDAQFDTFIASHRALFRKAVLKGGKPGLAKRVP